MSETSKEILHCSMLIFDFVRGLLEKANFELVVDERDDHLVVQWDHVRWDMVVHLLHALHENERSIGRESVLTSLSDGPALLLCVSDGTVIG